MINYYCTLKEKKLQPNSLIGFIKNVTHKLIMQLKC